MKTNRDQMDYIVPNHLLLETIKGVCTARCVMCDIKTWAKNPHIQSAELFTDILQKFIPYQKDIDYLSLFWRGEPLLDKELVAKIKIAKSMGFRSVGFSTNCTELSIDRPRELMEAGLDTIICCVDGIHKETHEAIRIGTNFDVVVDNVLGFISIRNICKYPTKVIIRFLRQKSNIHEEYDFTQAWNSVLNPLYGDAVEPFPVVECNGNIKDYSSIDALDGVETMNYTCKELFQRMIVTSEGNVNLCCGDGSETIKMGNVLNQDPIEIYNNPIFTKYREYFVAGRKQELDICKNCTAPRSHKLKEVANV